MASTSAGRTLNLKNVAAVMVTANLPAFSTQGTRIDVTVSALGDAKNLQGGTLLVTPLLGADGNVYAVAQGSLAISGFPGRRARPRASPGACRPSAASPTGRSSSAKSISPSIRLTQLRLALRNADFTTSKRIAAAINDFLGSPTAEPLDPSTVQISVPKEYANNVVALLVEIEQLQIEPDLPAKIIIDERSGIIVMGRDVRVSMVAVAQGNLTVTISEARQVSQPAAVRRAARPWSRRAPASACQEDGKKLAVVQEGVSLQQLVDGLNALGIGPRDLISILQAVKAAGAIQADVEVM